MAKRYTDEIRNHLVAIHQNAESALRAIELGEVEAAKGWLRSVLLLADVEAIDGGSRRFKKYIAKRNAEAREEEKRNEILGFYLEGDSVQDVLQKMELAGKEADSKTIRKALRR